MRKRRGYCCLVAVREGKLAAADVVTGGKGGAAPAVREPSPSFVSVLASSLPLGFSPCAS